MLVRSEYVAVDLAHCLRQERGAARADTGAGACSTAPAPAGISAGAISLGKAVGPDKKVSAPVEAFAKGDTIYASVETTGAGTATLKAKWTYKKGDQTTVVSEDRRRRLHPQALRQQSFTSANLAVGQPASIRWKCFLTTSPSE